ncbi:MAG: ABC transporter permease [Ignisphaera sp.]
MSLNRRAIQILRPLIRYKSFLIGLVILVFMVGLSIYATIAYPYDRTIKIWYDFRAWEDYPRLARPAWIKLFTGLSELEGTIILDSRLARGGFVKTRTPIVYGGEVKGIYIILESSFRYNYDVLPSQIVRWLYVNSTKPVYIVIEWIKPDGTAINVSKLMLNQGEYYADLSGEGLDFVLEYSKYISLKLGESPKYLLDGIIVLMGKEDKSILYRNTVTPSKGTYRVVVRAESSDVNANVDIKINIYGTLYGIAGTDDRRRDLFIAIAWGAPLALGFGLVASVLTTFIQMFVAALSAWYGGEVDMVIQRVNEIFMVLPFLPIVAMIALFYRLTIWSLLAVVVALGIWGGGLKTFRAMFLQIKEMLYIEAARAYGAGSMRIIIRYMLPRALPVIIPTIVIATPSYVFLEAALALLGLSDPTSITWGKVLEEAYAGAAMYRGYYHWILFPSVMLVLISIAFASIGFTLDRIFNPRLKEM